MQQVLLLGIKWCERGVLMGPSKVSYNAIKKNMTLFQALNHNNVEEEEE